jgi:hypothetical protein
VEISEFWQRDEVWSSDTSSQFWFEYKKPDTPTKVTEKGRSETRYFACECEDYDDVAGSFKPPSEERNDM